LDNALRVDLPDRAAIERAIGGPLEPPLVVVTLHPATLGERPEEAARALVDAMDRVPATYLITLPNADPGAATIRGQLRATGDRPRRYVVEALGESLYWGILRIAAALLGNSSSALIEAPLLQLPAVNVGARQAGRLRGKNVIDAPSDGAAIAAALRAALEPAFRARLAGTTSPYGDGRSGPRIVQELHAFAPPSPLRKPGVAPR
jgi:UDP-N-acetylglucosamine 2-epimerase